MILFLLAFGLVGWMLALIAMVLYFVESNEPKAYIGETSDVDPRK